MDNADTASSVLDSSDLLSQILHYALSNTKQVPSVSLTCRHWNDVLNKNPKTGRPLWRNICASQEPDFIRIFDLCQESKLCPNIPGGGWKTLLYRSLSSCYTPFGANKRLQRSLEMVFKPEGIGAFSNCCNRCTDSYENCSAFKMREKGITFFKLFLNGMNYDGSYPKRDVMVCYTDLAYLHENWEAECDIIRRWCAVLGLGVMEYSVEKPMLETNCIRVAFKTPVILEEEDYGDFDEYDEEVEEEEDDVDMDMDVDDCE